MNELTPLAASLGSLLKARKETIAVAESSAGGLIAAALLAVPGASAYFLGGGVIYTQAARRALLRVEDASVKGIRSSTEAYALLKARAIRASHHAGNAPRRPGEEHVGVREGGAPAAGGVAAHLVDARVARRIAVWSIRPGVCQGPRRAG